MSGDDFELSGAMFKRQGTMFNCQGPMLNCQEANWNLIYKNKMLFQSTNNYIDLGRSATNCHHYRVRMHCFPMFVLGNEFYQGIDQNPAAKHYVERNVDSWAVTTTLFA